MEKTIARAIENGALISGLIAVLLIGGAVYLTATGQQVPEWMITALTVIIGYFFGSNSAPKQFRRDDADRIQAALYETLPPHTKLEQLNTEFKREQRKDK
jgi:hypothetical protein